MHDIEHLKFYPLETYESVEVTVWCKIKIHCKNTPFAASETWTEIQLEWSKQFWNAPEGHSAREGESDPYYVADVKIDGRLQETVSWTASLGNVVGV